MEPRETFWVETYKSLNAYWEHSGDPTQPHALLTSGMHSGGFFNSTPVTENPDLLTHACTSLLRLAHDEFKEDLLRSITRVAGPAMGAITLASEMARALRSHVRGSKCLSCFAENSSDGTTMSFNRTDFAPNELVLPIEDVITTGKSTNRLIEACHERGATTTPFVLCLVNRSGAKDYGGKKIISLVSKHLPMWSALGCPLCREGSEAIRPKGTDAWKRLNRK